MIYAAPGASFEAVVNGYATGLATVRVRILDNVGATTYGPSTAGVAELVAGSGSYRVTLTAPTTAGQFSLGWDTGTVSPSTWTTEDLIVTTTGYAAPVASAGDLVTLAEVKLEIESTVTDDDALIQRLITGASRYVMRYTGREFVTLDAPATARPIELIAPVWHSSIPRLISIGDLSAAPTVVSTSDGFGGTATVLAAADYVVHPRVRRPDEPITALVFASVASLPYTGALSVTGTWGFPAVPEDVKHATILIVREWLSKSSSEWGMPDDIGVRGTGLSPIRFAMPTASKRILDLGYRHIGIA